MTKMINTWYVILNPTSGNGKGLKKLGLLKSLFLKYDLRGRNLPTSEKSTGYLLGTERTFDNQHDQCHDKHEFEIYAFFSSSSMLWR